LAQRSCRQSVDLHAQTEFLALNGRSGVIVISASQCVQRSICPIVISSLLAERG
jgi:hypothetical protein